MEEPVTKVSRPAMEQTEQGRGDLLDDLQLSLARAGAFGLQMENYPAHDDDAMLILQVLEGPRDEGDLDEWLSGGWHPSPLRGTNAHHQMGRRKSGPRGTRKRRMSPWMENYPAHDHDAMLILQVLEGPQDEGDLYEWLSGGWHPSPLQNTNVHHQMERRKTGPRGTRKRRMSPWKPLFFEKVPPARGSRELTTRKNNSHWTAKEVKSLVKGVSKLGVGQWTKMKKKYFKTSIRTAVHLKDKWRNLLKAYEEKEHKYTLLDLEPSLVEQIRELAAKHPYAKKSTLNNTTTIV